MLTFLASLKWNTFEVGHPPLVSVRNESGDPGTFASVSVNSRPLTQGQDPQRT